MNWVNPEKIIISYYADNNFSLELIKKQGKNYKIGTLVSFGNFCIVYRIVKTKADKQEKEIGIEDATLIYYYLADRFGNVSDLDGLFEVLGNDYPIEDAIEDAKKNWKEKIFEDIEDKIQVFNNGYTLFPELKFKKAIKRKMKEYEFFIKIIYPEKYKTIPKEIFE